MNKISGPLCGGGDFFDSHCISNEICHRMPPKLKSINGTSLWGIGAKFGEEGVDRYKPNFKAILERHEAVVCNRNRVDIFCRLSTMHERVRQTPQTDRPRNGNIDTNMRAMSPKNIAFVASYISMHLRRRKACRLYRC